MITKIFKSGNSLALRIPKDLNLVACSVNITRVGDRFIVEPIKEENWEKGFFDEIHIQNPEYLRADQGQHRDIVL
jgi:virulence-associated protein VagC